MSELDGNSLPFMISPNLTSDLVCAKNLDLCFPQSANRYMTLRAADSRLVVTMRGILVMHAVGILEFRFVVTFSAILWLICD